MPKPLSLKKVGSNQKPITQFFKNNGSDSHRHRITQSASNPSSTPSKRKAISPEKNDEAHIIDNFNRSCDETTLVEKHPKKQKKDKQFETSGPKSHEMPKKSTQKESGSKIKSLINNAKENHVEEIFVKKKSTSNCDSNQPVELNKEEKEVNSLSPQNASNNRSPLKDSNEKSCSPIKLSLTPKKIPSDSTDLRRSPRIAKLKTPDKLTQLQTKSPSAKVALDFDNNVEEIFSDKWDTVDIEKKNHVENIFNKKAPKVPVSPVPNGANPEIRRSPRIAKQKSPDKLTQSTRKAKVALDFGTNVEDLFDEDWDTADIEEECNENLDLSILQRCEVMNIEHQGATSILRLRNSENQWASCSIEGIWRDTPLSAGEIISVSAARTGGRFAVTNSAGVLVLRPDHLMSTTSVVAGVFCQRKAVLQERYKGIDGGNHAMTIGILVHELVQTALLNRIYDPARLRTETDKLIKQSTQMLYDSGLSVEETRDSMEVYIAPLADFMATYVADKPLKLAGQKNKWQGHIDEVLDIEENVCCPQLGLKGKIDATVQVTIHDRKERTVVPLELKSGRASGSAEHRGQIVLYNMMMSAQKDSRLASSQQSGLLLYLKEKADLREVTSGHPERRDLIMLRNQLVQYLADGPDATDPEKLMDIEEASHALRQRLPDPVHHENACSKCPYLTLCSLHLWSGLTRILMLVLQHLYVTTSTTEYRHTDGPQVSPTHPLSKLRSQALGHLSDEHAAYLLRWSALLRMEERSQAATSPLHTLWTRDPRDRSKRGTCAANLTLKCVQASADRFLHIFEREPSTEDQGGLMLASLFLMDNEDAKPEEKGPQEGEFSIVGVLGRPWLAAGVIAAVKGREIHIMLERDLSRRLSKDTLFHIDQYQSYATTVHNLTNLGVLMEDSDRAERLRKLIIDRQPPEFDAKLPREVGRLGAKTMRTLNIQQQRAVLKAVAAKDFSLLQGLPGTGKTQTISVMIQMLTALRRRVLVTAHTHSAVDTVLSRLPKSLRVLRLGASGRAAGSLRDRCEAALAAGCRTPDELQLMYDSMEVVGVTCLGAGHAMLARTTFDVCIVDEATQVLQCTVLRPLLAAKRFVLVGDPDQLPPIVRSRAARRLGMEESLFHRLQSESATSALRLQYRMNRRLVRLANEAAYEGRLQCASEEVGDARLRIDIGKVSQAYGPSSWLTTACSPDMEHAALFIDTGSSRSVSGPRGSQCANAAEACLLLALVDALIVGGVDPSNIGVIAPYREQVTLIKRALERFGASAEVSTVDQFQGRDKPVILYSCTRSGEDNDEAAKEGEVLNDQRRLAVSVTRAKHKFIAVGHSRALNKYASVRRMIDACTELVLPDSARECTLVKYGQFVC